ncbi:hypothetical protein FGG78_24360 [Thioclava sp. BHET1]|nr:hypothetical protein FGG78_24360 [Thioclava sp. BHET1]
MRSAGATRAFVALVVDDTVPELVFPVRVEGPVWQEVLVPFNLQRAGFSKGSARLRIGLPATGADTGALDLFGAELFAARAPVHGGNLRTFGAKAGAWDGPHLILGNWHFWVDTAGDLRRKASAPKHPSDGKVVGGA